MDLSQLIVNPEKDPKVVLRDMREERDSLNSPKNNNASSAYKASLSSINPCLNPTLLLD